MKKLVSLFVLLFVAISMSFAKPVPIYNFADLMKALNSGEKVKVVIYYGKCQLISNNQIEDKSPDAVGGMPFDTYEYFAVKAVRNEKAFVVTSTSKMIAYPKGNGYVYNYVKIKINEENKVQIMAQYIDCKTFETVMDESFFTTINDGKNDAAFFIYKED